MPAFESAKVVALVRLARLCIARAGETDSLRWWESEALSEPGRFVLGRLFPRTGVRVGVRLTIEAARARHAALCPADGLHLFSFRPSIERDIEAGGGDPPEVQPCRSPLELRDRMLELGIVSREDLAAIPKGSDGPLPVGEIPRSDAMDLERLQPLIGRLASAYSLGRTGAPVLPYLRLK